MTDTTASPDVLGYLLLQITGKLGQAEQAATDGDFAGAEALLQQARKIAGTNSDLLKEVETTEDTIKGLRVAQVDTLLAEAQALLGDPEAFDEGRIGALLDESLRLDEDNRTALELRDQLPAQAREYRGSRIYRSALAECQALWEKADELVAASVPSDIILNDCFKKALELAQRTAANHPDVVQLKGLVRETTREYNQARDRFEVLTTAAETGAYRTLMAVLDRETDPDKSVPLVDAMGNDLGVMTVAEARRKTQRMAEEYGHEKAIEYLGQARTHVEAHAPRAARDQLAKRLDLLLLDQETNKRLEVYFENTVKPALEQLEEAEEMLARAVKADDPAKGWEQVDEAIQIYAYVPEVEAVRKALIPRLISHVKTLLVRGRRYLNNDELKEAKQDAEAAGHWSGVVERHVAGQGLDRYQSQVQDIAGRASQLVKDCQAEEKLLREVARAARELEKELETDPAAASQRWAGLKNAYGVSTLARFPKLRDLRREIEAYQGLAALVGRLEGVFEHGDLEALRAAVQECEAAINDDYKKDADAITQLTPLREKLQGRLDYQTATGLLGGGNADAALKLLDKVANRAGHPDSADANAEAKKIRDNIKYEEKVTEALQEARRHLRARGRNRRSRLRQAYETLSPYADPKKPTVQYKEVQAVLRKARMAWEAQLVADIEAEQSKSPLNLEKLQELVDELQMLPEPRPVGVAERALAIMAAHEAQTHVAAEEWGPAANKWQQALTHDGLNAEYKRNWREARKWEAEINILRAGSFEEASAPLAELENDLPRDPEVKEWKARDALRWARQAQAVEEELQLYGEARQALRDAYELLERPGAEPWPALRGRLEDLEDQVDEREPLAHRRRDVEVRLKLDRILEDFYEADRLAGELLQEHPGDGELKSWWADLKQRTVEALEPQVSALPDEKLWERFQVASKILALEPNHGQSRKMLTQLPNLAMDLGGEIDEFVGDREGVKISGPDEDVLRNQKKKALALRQRAQAVYSTLSRFAGDIPDGTGQGLQYTLSGKLQGLQSALEQLGQVRQFKGSAEVAMDIAQATDDWFNFNTLLNKINEIGFGQHRTIRALKARREALEEKRKQLLILRQALVVAAEDEDFVRARQLARQLTDPEQGDPVDTFGVQAELRITDPVSEEAVKGWDAVDRWLEERQAQIERLRNWLYRAGAGDIVAARGLAVGPPPAAAPRQVVAWSSVEAQVERLVEQGGFQPAADLARQVQEGQSDWYDADDRILALRPAVDRLTAQPVTPTQALSHPARALLEAAGERQEVIRKQLKALKKKLAWVKDQGQRWADREVELEQAFAELQRVKDGRWPFGKTRRLRLARERVYAALLACREIAPEHPDLKGQRDHPLLRES